MLSRILWIGLTGIALIAGIALQDGPGIFSWDHGADRSVAERVDAAIDRGIDKMQVTGSDGEEIDVPPETKRALADAIGRLVKTETELAMLRFRDGSKEDIAAADARRDQTKAEVEAIKDRIEGQNALADERRAELREQIRVDVRESVRRAVKN